MASGEITLKRMNHSRSLIQFFEGLMESRSLVDCTIAAEGQYLKAHRVILSACSPYFEMLFSQENEKNPIIVLTDTKFEVLKAVVDFIYRGQINIPQDHLKCFVAAIESLQIIGMENGSENIEETGTRMQLSSSSVQTEWPECNSVSSFRMVDEAEQENSTEWFPIENKYQVKTEEGIVEATQVYERSDGNAEESTAACCIQTDASYVEKSANSDGTTNASEKSARSKFCLGGIYDPASACRLTPIPLLEQNLPNAVSSTSWAQSGVCSVETNDVDVHDIPISEKYENDADHCNMEVNNSESAGEFAEESFLFTHCTSSFPNTLDLDAQKTHCHLSGHSKKPKQTNTEERSYFCDECGVSFSQSQNLKKHKRTHTGEKPYRCDECGIFFRESGHLKRHKRTHTGEKPYRCDECGIFFRESGTLKNHKRTHTGEKPYRCDECGIFFRESGHLKTHKRTHTGESPYRCADCGVSFKTSGALTRHKRTHTGEMPTAVRILGNFFC